MTRPLPAVLLLAACGFSSTGHPGGGGEPPPGVPPCGIICGMRKGWTEEASMLELDCEPVIIGNPREVRRLGGSGVMTWRAQCWRGVYR